MDGDTEVITVGVTQEATGEVAGAIQATGVQVGAGATQDTGEAVTTATTIITTLTEEEVLPHIMEEETTLLTDQAICQVEATLLIETTLPTEIATQQIEITQPTDLATVIQILEELLQ